MIAWGKNGEIRGEYVFYSFWVSHKRKLGEKRADFSDKLLGLCLSELLHFGRVGGFVLRDDDRIHPRF